MSVTRQSGVVEFDADRAVETARAVLGPDLRAVAEFDVDEYRLLYVAGRVVETYGGESPIQDAAARLHGYIHLDFVERELFEDIAAQAGELQAYVTRLDDHTFVRYLIGSEGLFLSVETGCELEPLLSGLETVADGPSA